MNCEIQPGGFLATWLNVFDVTRLNQVDQVLSVALIACFQFP